VGGSGTRVVAAFLNGLGYDIGNNLNRALDDLTFTALFKRPDLYRGVNGLIPAGHPAAVKAVDLFVRVRRGHRGMATEMLPMTLASLSLPSKDEHHGLRKIRNRLFRRERRIAHLKRIFARTDAPLPELWGWKEPNSLLYLPTLFDRIGGLHYIHVVRNGLAMATSANDYQLMNWGSHFGVDDESRDVNLRQLVYWARANLAAAAFYEKTDRFLVVSHERAVLDPMGVAEEIATFVGRPLTDETQEEVARVRRPDDFERTFRSREGEMSTAEAEDVHRALEHFGYSEPHP
jgi:hypothetical protein